MTLSMRRLWLTYSARVTATETDWSAWRSIIFMNTMSSSVGSRGFSWCALMDWRDNMNTWREKSTLRCSHTVNVFTALWFFCDDTLLFQSTHCTSTCLIISTSLSGFLHFPEWLLKTLACVLTFRSYCGSRKLHLFLFYGRFHPMWFFSISSIYIEWICLL